MNFLLKQIKLLFILGTAVLSFQACSSGAGSSAGSDNKLPYFDFHSKYFFACTDTTNSNFISLHINMDVLLLRSGYDGNTLQLGSNVTVDNLFSYKTNNPLVSEDDGNEGNGYLGDYPSIGLYVDDAYLVYSNGSIININNISILTSASSNHIFTISEGYHEYRILMEVDKSFSNSSGSYIWAV